MTTRAIGRFAALASGILMVCGPALGGGMVEGTWLTPDLAELTIGECELGFCGVLSKIVISEQHVAQYGVRPADIKVEEIIDAFNENPALRGRPMLGLQILTMRATSNPWHFEGEVYNPQDGKTYAGFMDVQDADTVILKGCALYVLCMDQVWTRVIVENLEAEVAQ